LRNGLHLMRSTKLRKVGSTARDIVGGGC